MYLLLCTVKLSTVILYCYVTVALLYSLCSGVAHRAFENDMHTLYEMRQLFDFLPLSNKDPVPIRFTEDPKYVRMTFTVKHLGLTYVSMVKPQICNTWGRGGT